MKTRITIIRHGETEWNVAMRLQGNGDSALTEKGIAQVERAAMTLQTQKFDVLISSDQKRAYRTAEIINRYHELSIIKDTRFRERHFGIMEGLTREEILDRYPEVHAGYMRRKEYFQVPEGESLIQFFERTTKGLRAIINTYAGKRILLITHGGVLDCVMRMTFDIPLGAKRSFSISNAAINTFSVQEDHWMLEEWGNTG